MPTNNMANINSTVATGLKMNGRDGLNGGCSPGCWGFPGVVAFPGVAAFPGAPGFLPPEPFPRGEEPPGTFPGAAGLPGMTTLELSCNLSKLLFASTSPGDTPVTCVVPPSVTPGLIVRICAVLSCRT